MRSFVLHYDVPWGCLVSTGLEVRLLRAEVPEASLKRAKQELANHSLLTLLKSQTSK